MLICFCLKIGSHCVAQVGLELAMQIKLVSQCTEIHPLVLLSARIISPQMAGPASYLFHCVKYHISFIHLPIDEDEVDSILRYFG